MAVTHSVNSFQTVAEPNRKSQSCSHHRTRRRFARYPALFVSSVERLFCGAPRSALQPSTPIPTPIGPKMLVSENRQFPRLGVATISLWSCLIERLVIVLSRAAIRASTDCCSWPSPRLVSTAGRCALPAPRSPRIAGFSVPRQRRRKPVFALVCVAVRKPRRISRVGVEPRTWFPEPWR